MVTEKCQFMLPSKRKNNSADATTNGSSSIRVVEKTACIAKDSDKIDYGIMLPIFMALHS